MSNKLRLIAPLFILLAFGIVACHGDPKKETRAKDQVYDVASDDEAMNKIIDDARKTVGEFIAALDNPAPGVSDFAVKFPFDTDPGSDMKVEHIWLMRVGHADDKYFGIVSNDPLYIKRFKLGDRVDFDITKISDWKYTKNGYLVGGQSIVYFYDQMSDEEKKDFDKDAGFKIKK